MVTAPVAMGISESIGGSPTLTAVLVILTGITGAVVATPLLNLLGMRDWRARGFAVDDGNYIAGVTVVAAPVFKAPDLLSHALVAIGVSGAVKRAGLAKLEDMLVASARKLSRRLQGE